MAICTAYSINGMCISCTAQNLKIAKNHSKPFKKIDSEPTIKRDGSRRECSDGRDKLDEFPVNFPTVLGP